MGTTPKGDVKVTGEGNSLAVQWSGLGAFTARALVQSQVGELRSCTIASSEAWTKKKCSFGFFVEKWTT